MTQHIRVLSTESVKPYEINVWRDDQTLMWLLAPHLQWPDDEQYPIQFETSPPAPFLPWPGSVPSPIGEKPSGPDQRPYVALCGKTLEPGANPEQYVYKLLVYDTVAQKKVRLQLRREGDTENWYDPDVGNQPLP